MNVRPHAGALVSTCLLLALAGALDVPAAFAAPPGSPSIPPLGATGSAGYGLGQRLVPTQNINSVAQKITASGDHADIYYPDLPIHGASVHRLPPVILLQGAQVDKQYYSQFAQELARYGFVVIVPNHVSRLFGSGLFAEMNVITDTLAHVKAETMDPDSPLYDIVDTTRAALSGHSFGSAAALFALASYCTFPFCDTQEGFQLPSEIKAAALIAGNSGAIDLDTQGLATALLIGDLDTGLEESAAAYETLEAPRAFIVVHGANHYGLNDVAQPPEAQVRAGEASQTLPQSITASRFAHWAGLFLRAQLYRDKRAARRIYESGGDDDVTVTATAR